MCIWNGHRGRRSVSFGIGLACVCTRPIHPHPAKTIRPACCPTPSTLRPLSRYWRVSRRPDLVGGAVGWGRPPGSQRVSLEWMLPARCASPLGRGPPASTDFGMTQCCLWIDWGVERSRAVLAHAAGRLAPRASSTLQTSSPFHPPQRQLPTAASSKPRPARAAAPHTPLYRVDGSIDGGGPRRLNSVGRSLDRFGPAALPHHPNRSSSIKMRGGAPQGPAAAVSYQSRTPHTHHSLTTPPHIHPKPHRVGRLQPPCNVRTRDRAEGKEGGRRLLAYRPATSAQRR